MDEKKNTYNVIGLGEILWDLLPEGKQLGGAPANFAYHAQVLGGTSFIISAIGDDPLGDEILDQLRRIDWKLFTRMQRCWRHMCVHKRGPHLD